MILETPFVKLSAISGNKLYRKSKLCWILQKDFKKKISTDIRRRFVANTSRDILDASHDKFVWKINIVSKGDFIIISFEGNLYYGCVLNFQKAKQKLKSQRLCNHDYIDIQKSKGLQFLLDPIHHIQRDYSLENSDQNHFYFPVCSYVCHISNGNVNLKSQAVKTFIRNCIKEN